MFPDYSIEKLSFFADRSLKETEPETKKSKSKNNSKHQDTFTKILENCNRLEELEIWACQK